MQQEVILQIQARILHMAAHMVIWNHLKEMVIHLPAGIQQLTVEHRLLKIQK